MSSSLFNSFLTDSEITTNALTTIPRLWSGLATAADSKTAGCDINADSTSKGPIRYLKKVSKSSTNISNGTELIFSASKKSFLLF